jgi:sialidase-1
MLIRYSTFSCAALFLLGPCLGAAPAPPEQTDVFVSGKDGYHTFRIPSAIVTPQGTVLAFCEGRKNGRGDAGDIDLVLKRSRDGGKTWGPMQTVWDDGPNTCGNPCPVVDRASGTVWLLMTHNLGQDHEKGIIARTSKGTRTVWVCKSEDDGRTWSKPAEITASAKKADWTWYATGPGVGIQTRQGRLVIPCDHIEADTRRYFSHVLFSDDHGQSWKLGGRAGPGTNESQVAELAGGALLLNMRNSDRGQDRRAVATSTDGGLTWSAVTRDPGLPEPHCQASLLRFTGGPGPGKDRLLFANPASTRERVALTVRLSYDGGKTWPAAKPLHTGPSAYSCLTVLPDRTLGCLYERGAKSPYETISFARFSLGWLTDGKDTPERP